MLPPFESLWRTHRFAAIVAAYALGVVAVAGASIAHAAVFALCALAGVLAAARRRRYVLAPALALLAGASAAQLAIRLDEHRPYAVLDGRHVVVDAVALERPRHNDSDSLRVRIVAVRFPLSPQARSLEGRVAIVTFPAADVGTLAGRNVQIRGRLDLPGGARNDGEPAQRDVLADQGVSVMIVAHRARDVRAFGDASGWEAWWARARLTAADAIERKLPPLEATVLEGVLWGDRGGLPASLRQEFSDTGTVHVLTTAGLHLGIMAGFVAWLLAMLPIARPYRVVLTVGAAWAYAMLAGLHLPTLRAATMLTAGAAANELQRGRTPSAIFAAAAAAVIAPHPLLVLSPSFAMSFACVVGIALVSPVLKELGLRDGDGGPLGRIVVEAVRTSLAVAIALWPLQALYFNAFTPYAVLANAVVVPLIAAIMAGGALLCAAALTLPALAVPLANVVWWGLLGVIQAVGFFSSLPASHIDVPPPSHAFLVAYWVLLAMVATAVHYGWGRRAVAQACALAAPVLILIYCAPGIAQTLDRSLRLDAIDVGQADCILIRAPGGHAMLVDGGGRLERTAAGFVVAAPIGDKIATRTVMPFLLRHWVLHLDAIVLTHPHGDHAGGLPVIMSRERVGALYDSAQPYSGPAYRRALGVVRERRIRWVHAQRGVAFDLGSQTHVQVLEPELPLLTQTSSDINNNSVVLRVTYGSVAILLTGDAQAEAERRLLSHGTADLRADILKVGHHGSAYSSTPQFLAAVRPRIAIISCGLHNVFGHPSPRTVTALRAAGAAVFRTDLNGGISVWTDGQKIHSRTTL